MVPGMFSNPPSVAPRRGARREARDVGTGRSSDAILVALAVFLAGIVGFLGLLIAGSLIPRAATPLRALALVWFAVFGVWHFRTSARFRVTKRAPKAEGSRRIHRDRQ